MGLNSSQPCCVYNSRNPPRVLNPHLPLLSSHVKKLMSAQAQATCQHFATARKAGTERPAQARTLSPDPAHHHSELPAQELDIAAPPLNSTETPARDCTHQPAAMTSFPSASLLPTLHRSIDQPFVLPRRHPAGPHHQQPSDSGREGLHGQPLPHQGPPLLQTEATLRFPLDCSNSGMPREDMREGQQWFWIRSCPITSHSSH